MDLPELNDEETLRIDKYNALIEPYKDCYINKICRLLCYKFITAIGIDFSYLDISILYVEMFNEYFKIYYKWYQLEELANSKKDISAYYTNMNYSIRLLNAKVSAGIIFSNLYNFSTFNLSYKVDNMTFIDEINYVKVLINSFFILILIY